MASYQQGVTRALGNDQKGKPHSKSRPLLIDLLKELKSVVNNWQLLMINMGVEKFENDKIEKNFQNDTDRQKQEAFDKWLRMKPDACWKDVIDALYEIEEITLASILTRKYAWEDPRVSVTWTFLSTSKFACITAKRVGDIPCRRFLPTLNPGLDYYTLEDGSVRPINESLKDFFRSIEDSSSKGDFRVGLEARFGSLYLKMKPENVLPANSTNQSWRRSQLLRYRSFNTQVEEADVKRLFIDKEVLGKKLTRITLTFVVEGQDEGRYSAHITSNEDDFRVDAVYRETQIKNKAKLDIALPGRKYDLRVSDGTECILCEHKNSIPYQIAKTTAQYLYRLLDGRLRVILRGSSPNNESTWKVKHIRQRVQRQYKWKPEKKWSLARYDVDVFEYDNNQDVVDTAPLKGVDIAFDYSRKEVELWGQKIFPKNVSGTRPSRDKYYYMEGIEGVRLPGGELREPYNWTTEELLRDFEEFLGDAFKIAHILDGSPY
ncbi:uncharacterized protein LOC135335953 isoform X2 [Halichondria panicea]|uniref:uncharacterized protein LOC135335953 isoform X2 n=1 Tax=Halichondria panicea TaxID=6063 RepID=UPI00312B8052